MKVIIAGSRDIHNYEELLVAVAKSEFTITEVVSGGARGVDALGEIWARRNMVSVKRFIPDWNLLGKPAGMVRNSQMAQYADALIALWDGKSYGTKNMIETAEKLGLKVYVHQV